MLNLFEKEFSALEEMYYDFLDENCKCNIEEDGCSCPDFNDWLDERREDAAC
jgi:hypothetical protein